MTTLEDVFLRLEAEAEVDQAGECVAKLKIAADLSFFERQKSAGALVLSESRFTFSDYSVFNREQADDECDAASLDDTDQRLLTFSDTKSDVVTGHALWRQQFSTVAWLHMLNMRRERKAFIYT